MRVAKLNYHCPATTIEWSQHRLQVVAMKQNNGSTNWLIRRLETVFIINSIVMPWRQHRQPKNDILFFKAMRNCWPNSNHTDN